MPVSDNLHHILQSLPATVRLVAVTKTYPPETVLEAYRAGHRVFGENRVQELTSKYEVLPKDIEWHLIGHLQKNKVKYIAPFVAMIHAVDDTELLSIIEKEAAKAGRVIPCLIQIHIAAEEHKFGFSYDEARELFKGTLLSSLPHVQVCGLMGMATFTNDKEQVRREFHRLAVFFRELKETAMRNVPSFTELSMGMSGDYPLAVEEGATLVRVGSAIFGKR